MKIPVPLIKAFIVSIVCALIVGCVHGGGGGGGEKDNVVITSADEMYGPGGLTTSCISIALLYGDEHGSIGGEKILQRGYGSNSQIDLNREWGGVRFSKWTPRTLEFLKTAVDECVSENSSIKNLGRAFDKNNQGSLALNMSPSGAKDMFNQIYLAIENTRKNQSQATEDKRQQLANETSRNQGLKAGLIAVGSLKDAAVKFDAADAYQIVMSPKIKADGKNYIVGGYLEKYTKNTFIATTVPVQGIGSVPFNTRYVVLVPQAFEARYQNTARIGGGIGIIGKYVGNRNLELVMGNSVTVPVFEMIYMDQK